MTQTRETVRALGATVAEANASAFLNANRHCQSQRADAADYRAAAAVVRDAQKKSAAG